jgi:hypothetical protein
MSVACFHVAFSEGMDDTWYCLVEGGSIGFLGIILMDYMYTIVIVSGMSTPWINEIVFHQGIHGSFGFKGYPTKGS